MMKVIDEWVYDSNSFERLVFQVQSYSLKKALSKEVAKIYMGRGVFTDYFKESTEVVIKKSKSFNQCEFLRSKDNQAPFSQQEQIEESQSTFENNNNEDIDQEMKDDSQSTTVLQKAEEGVTVAQSDIKIEPVEELINHIKTNNLEVEQKTMKFERETANDQLPIKKMVDVEIDYLFKQELGFSRVIQMLIDSKKPIIGHNMMYDMMFTYQLCSRFQRLNFKQQWLSRFPQTYDTKSISMNTNTSQHSQLNFHQTDLKTLFQKCSTDKKLRNNLQITLDKEKDSLFGLYENQTNCQEHDAGYDAYMTGYVFASISKFIEIGKILDMQYGKKSSENSSDITATADQDTQNQLESNKRKKARKGKKPRNSQNNNPNESEEEEDDTDEDLMIIDDIYKHQSKQNQILQSIDSPTRQIKHFSLVQNKPIYFTDLGEFQNKIMMCTDLPRYFALDLQKTQLEQQYERQKRQNVIQIEFQENVSIYELSEIFSVYGDINIVKSTKNLAYVEFSNVDNDIIKTNTLKEIIEKATDQILNNYRHILVKQAGFITTFEKAQRFIS